MTQHIGSSGSARGYVAYPQVGCREFSQTGASSVTLYGILWGGNSSGTLFVFSPLTSIERELGALTTH